VIWVQKIFDQWGNRVFEINEVNGKWDGLTNNGTEAPEGTYFYYVTATGYGGTNHERQGSVMLLRADVEVSPNPAKGFIKIKPTGLPDGPLIIDLFNTQGNIAYSKVNDKSEEFSVDLSALQQGIYILRVCNTNQCIYKKVIKQ